MAFYDSQIDGKAGAKHTMSDSDLIAVKSKPEFLLVNGSRSQ